MTIVSDVKMDKKVLVTGATGFIGKHLASKLAEANVRCLARGSSSKEKVRELQSYGEVVYGDVRDRESLQKAVNGVDAVIHLVGIMAGMTKEKVTYEQIHVQGMRNLVNACSEEGVGRFVYVSALGASPNAVTEYWRSKYEAEEIVRNSSMNYTIFRPSFVHGEGDMLVSMYVRWMKQYHMAFVPKPNARSQPLHVDDLVHCLIKSLYDEKTKNKTYEIGGPDRLTLDEFVDNIKDVLNVRALKIHAPSFMVKLTRFGPMSKAYQKVFLSPPTTSEQLLMLQMDNTCDIEQIERDFGIVLKPFKEALKAYV